MHLNKTWDGDRSRVRSLLQPERKKNLLKNRTKSLFSFLVKNVDNANKNKEFTCTVIRPVRNCIQTSLSPQAIPLLAEEMLSEISGKISSPNAFTKVLSGIGHSREVVGPPPLVGKIKIVWM